MGVEVADGVVAPVHLQFIFCLCSKKEKLKDSHQGDEPFYSGILEKGFQKHFLMLNSSGVLSLSCDGRSSGMKFLCPTSPLPPPITDAWGFLGPIS